MEIMTTDQKTTSPMRVLLVCVYNISGRIISHDIFYRLFSSYGKVQKILIFDKSKVWKTFVEMESGESAERAKEELNNYTIFEDGSKLNVFFSNLETINFQNSNSGGVDYTQSYKPEKEKQLRLPRIVTPTFPFPTSSLASPKKFQTWGCCSELLESENNLKDRAHQSDEKNEEADYDIINLDFISENENKREEEEEQEARRREEEERRIEEEERKKEEEERRREEERKKEEEEKMRREEEERRRREGGGMKLEVWHEEEEDRMVEVSLKREDESFDVTVDKRELRCFTFEKIEERNENEFDDTTTYNGENFEEATKKLDSLINSLSHTCTPNQPKKKKLTLKSTSFMREEGVRTAGVRREEGGKREEGERKDEGGVRREKEWRSLPSLNSPFSPFEPYESPFCSADVKLQNFFKFNVGPPSPVKEVKEVKKEIADPTTYVNPNFLIENKKSAVLYVRGITNESITLFQLFNLFGSFGNITKILRIRPKFAALIEFQSIEFSTQAKDFLNNTVLLGNQLKIFYSNYETIKLKNELNNNNFNQSDLFLGIQEMYRYPERSPDGKPLLMNPPSVVLHISKISKEFCKYDFICQVFNPFGKIEGIKFLNNNNSTKACQMFLLKFSTLESSFNALSNLHGREFFGKKIVISFTRSKI